MYKFFLMLSLSSSMVFGMENKTNNVKNKIKRCETSTSITFLNGNITYIKYKKNNEIYAYITDKKSGGMSEFSHDEKYLEMNYRALESLYNEQLKQSEK